MPEKPRSELDATRLIDAELVRLARQGSISALRLIVRRHNQRLYRVARAIVRDNTEAEDVMQEAYLSAFGNLANFRAEANLSTWLTRIVVNKAIGHLRSERIMAPLEAVEDIERLEAGAAAMPNLASGFDPERAATRSQVRDLLERAIDNLPEPLRVVFMMRMVEQLSVRETAISLGIRQETVRTRLYRANKLMRERLQTTLAPRFTDTFPFEGPRCAEYTCALLTRLSERSQPASR